MQQVLLPCTSPCKLSTGISRSSPHMHHACSTHCADSSCASTHCADLAPNIVWIPSLRGWVKKTLDCVQPPSIGPKIGPDPMWTWPKCWPCPEWELATIEPSPGGCHNPAQAHPTWKWHTADFSAQIGFGTNWFYQIDIPCRTKIGLGPMLPTCDQGTLGPRLNLPR